MQAAISTELLTRLLRATPEQMAAIELILGGERPAHGGGMPRRSSEQADAVAALIRIERKVDGLVAGARLPEKKEPPREAECLKVFRLFSELLAMGTGLTAPPARVFDLLVYRKLTKAEVAVECKCAASLITRRVAAIEGHFGMSMATLRDFASDIKERQRTVKGDRYARKKGGAVQEDREQYEERDQPGLKEDDDGYLPEEKPDYSP